MISEWEMSLRIFISILLGGVIGMERELGSHAAGFRTHILVCLGASLVMMLSIYGFSAFVFEANVRMDPARLAAQVVSGIGFLGAGTILRTGRTVSGLTTAASLWVVAAIGLSVGAGFYYAAGLTTAAVLVSLFVLNKLEQRLSKPLMKKRLTFELAEPNLHINGVLKQLKEAGADICDLQMDWKPSGEEKKQANAAASRIQLIVKMKPGAEENVLGILLRLPGLASFQSHRMDEEANRKWMGRPRA